MDPERFDRLTASISRRTSLLGLLIGGTAAAWRRTQAAGKNKKCKQAKKCAGRVCGNFGCKGKSCGSCRTDNPCQEASCSASGACTFANRPSGTSCGAHEEKCGSGICVQKPICESVQSPCTTSDECCSGSCDIIHKTCHAGVQGDLCQDDGDCSGFLKCPAYRCV